MNVQTRTVYDAIVVGSGMSGGWAMKALCEAGLRTLVLERGRALEHGAGYVTEHKPPWEMPGRGRIPPPVRIRDYPVQRRNPVLSEYTQHFFYRDDQVPIVEERPFTWTQPGVVGGRSLLWGRQAYRFGPQDFQANARDGHGVDWPFRYEDVAPWYDQVEAAIGVSGAQDGLPQLPDGRFQPPMEMYAVERHARDRIREAFPDRHMVIGRTATLTQSLGDRAACHYCGPCERGCSTGSYFSTQSVALPAARATGNLTLQPESVVHSILYDPATNRVTGVRVIDAQTLAEREVHGRMVFLCASALGTARILLASTSARFPDGLANSSGVVGRYIMDHESRAGARGTFDGFEDRYYRGNRPNGVYVPRFRNLDVDRPHPDFVRGYAFHGTTQRLGWGRGASMAGFGQAFKQRLRRPGRWEMQLGMVGEFLPREENRCELDVSVTDAWGLPALRLHVTRGPNEEAMRRDAAQTAAECLEAAGARDVQIYDRPEVPPGTTNHEMGTVRMGRDSRTSALNGFGQSHDVPNLFVTDGSVMASSACQNPSLTYLALTARACAYAVEQLSQGRL